MAHKILNKSASLRKSDVVRHKRMPYPNHIAPQNRTWLFMIGSVLISPSIGEPAAFKRATPSTRSAAPVMNGTKQNIFTTVANRCIESTNSFSLRR